MFGVGRQEKILILDESSDKKLIVAVNDDEAINYYETLMSENKSVDLLINNLETQVSKFSSATQINVLKTLQDKAITILREHQSILNIYNSFNDGIKHYLMNGDFLSIEQANPHLNMEEIKNLSIIILLTLLFLIQTQLKPRIQSYSISIFVVVHSYSNCIDYLPCCK